VNTNITDVLASILGNYSLVYAWDAATGSWLKYDTSAPGYANTLSTLDERMGFWVKMTTAAWLNVTGAQPVITSIPLAAGWNLVGYPASADLALPDALSLHGVGSDFNLVYAWFANDATQWKKFDLTAPSFANTLTELAPGYGYWIDTGGSHTWFVNY
jgi:hypothetical protein